MSKERILSLLLIIIIPFLYINAQNKEYTHKGINFIYAHLLKGRPLIHKEIKGEFVYIVSNEKQGKYVAKFISKGSKLKIKYIIRADNSKDTIVFGSKIFPLSNYLDPTSFNLYKLYFKNKSYICIIGQAQSASGSSVQLSFFNIFELNASQTVIRHYEFVSRFGDINSLVDYDMDGNLDYYKIVNGDEMGELLLTINSISNNKKINNRSLFLRYELNDKFTVIKDFR